jgi:hypothetical protein
VNERIKLLAELCYEVKPSMVENSQKIGNDGVPLYREVFNQEKFAELIVRECMDICAEREYDIRTRIKDEGKAATAYMIRAYIKEHFGVEE